MGGYIRWTRLVGDDTQAIEITERLTGRQLDPWSRNLIMSVADLPRPSSSRPLISSQTI